MEFLFVILVLALIAMPIIALSIGGNNQNRIKELEKEIKKLRAELSSFILEKTQTLPRVNIQNESSLVPEEKINPIPIKEEIHKEAEIIIAASPSLPPYQETKNVPPPQPNFFETIISQTRSMTSSEWETLIGGKILNRIGALAVIIGVGFFLKYAFDNNWITEAMRVFIGIAIGFLLLFAGHYYNKKGLLIFSKGLTGAGISILYLSVYASFNYYHLVSQIVAFIVMIAVTVISFWQAFKYHSIVISLFSWLGGTLTPFLLSTGNANESGLFLYVVFFNTGLLYIALKRANWSILEPLTLLSTGIIYLSWRSSYYMPQMCLETSLFLSIFWATFLSFEIIKITSPGRKITLLNQGVSLANGTFFYLTMYSIVNTSYPKLMGPISVIITLSYLSVYLLTRKKRPSEEYLLTRYLLSSILLSVCASLIQFTDFEITISIAIESYLLAWLAKKDKNKALYWASIALLALSIFIFLTISSAFHIYPSEFHLLVNIRSAALITILLSAFGSGALNHTLNFKFSKIIKPALTYTWIVVLFTLITVETSDLFDYLWSNSIGNLQIFYRDNFIWFLQIEWILFALLLFYYSFKKTVTTHLYSSLVLISVALLFSVTMGFDKFSPSSMFLPVLNLRSLSLLSLCVALWLILNTFRKEKYKFLKVSEKIIGISIAFLFFIFLTTDTRDIFEKRIDSFSYTCFPDLIIRIGYLMELSLSGIWLVYSIALMVTGIYKRNFDIRITSIILFGVTILKIFFYDLSNLDTLHRIFSFIGLGVTLLLVSYLYHKYKHIILPEK